MVEVVLGAVLFRLLWVVAAGFGEDVIAYGESKCARPPPTRENPDLGGSAGGV